MREGLGRALDRVIRQYGDPDGGGWRWSGIRHANIRHLAGIAAFNAPSVSVQGGPSTLSPSSGSGRFGASWRMVVEMGPEIRAWGIYPGGQSGNPMSVRYTDRLDRWARGALDTLLVPREAAAIPADVVSGRLTLVPR